MLKKFAKDSYSNGFSWQGDLPLTKLSCTHFVKVFPCTDLSRYISNDRYREQVMNAAIERDRRVCETLFGLPLEHIGGTRAILWGELLRPPPTHQLIVGYIVRTGKTERFIIDVQVSFGQLNKDEKEISTLIGRHYVQLLQSSQDRWDLFCSGDNSKRYLERLQSKYKALRGVLG